MEKMKQDVATIKKGMTVELALVGSLLGIVGMGAFWAASIQSTVSRMGEDIAAMRSNQEKYQEKVLTLIQSNDRRLTTLEVRGK